MGPAGWDARRRAIHCVAAPPEVLSLRSLYCGAMEGAPSVRRKRESRKRKFSKRKCGHPRTGGAEACRATMPHPRGVHWAPFWAFCYVITDLRIYPPPSPSHPLRQAPTRSRASANQVTAGYELSEAYGVASHALDRHGICRSGTPSSSAPPHCALTKTFSRLQVSSCVGKLESRLKTQDHKGPLNSRLKITQHLLTHDSRSLSNS